MESDISERLRARLHELMNENGLNVLSWSTKAGIPESTLRNFLAGRSNTMTHLTLAYLSKAIDLRLDSFLYKEENFENVRVFRSITAANWATREPNYLMDNFMMKLPLDPRGLGAGRMGFAIGDDHCDQIFKEGDIVIIQNYKAANRDPVSGDVMVAIQTLKNGDGYVNQTTVRKLVEHEGRHYLIYQSTSPLWTEAIPLPTPMIEAQSRDKPLTYLGVTIGSGHVQYCGRVVAAYTLR